MEHRTKHTQKPKTGSVAIPFLITMLISIVVIGGAGIIAFQNITHRELDLKVPAGATTSISEEDIHCSLFILQPDQPDHPERKNTVMMLHFDPVRKTEYCIGIPNNLQLEYNDSSLTVESCLETYGADALRNALATLFDQEITHYVEMDSEGFQKIVSIIGNVTCVVTIQDEGLQPSETSQMLDAAQMETLLTSDRYNTEVERSAVVGMTVSALLNQCNGKRIASNLDGYFSAMMSACISNITSQDYTDHRHAVSYFFEYATTPAKSMTVVGTEQNGGFVMDESFPEALKVMFSQIS